MQLVTELQRAGIQANLTRFGLITFLQNMLIDLYLTDLKQGAAHSKTMTCFEFEFLADSEHLRRGKVAELIDHYETGCHAEGLPDYSLNEAKAGCSTELQKPSAE